MCGKHYDRDERIGTVQRGPDNAREINAIERLHHPVRQHDIGRKVPQFVIGLAAFLRSLDDADTEGRVLRGRIWTGQSVRLLCLNKRKRR